MATPTNKTFDIRRPFRTAFSVFAARPIQLLLIASVTVLINLLVRLSPFVALFSFLLSEIVVAALAYYVYQYISHGAPSVLGSYKIALEKFVPILEFQLRYIGAIILLAITVVGIPFAIRVGIRWHFGTYAVILNGETAKEAISHSCRVVSGLWWQVFWTLLLLGLVVASPNIGANFIWPRNLPGIVSSSLWTLIATALNTAFMTALYVQLDEQDRRLAEAEVGWHLP